MCGIGGIVNLKAGPIPRLDNKLNVISSLIAHRGPDGSGQWYNDSVSVGLVHRRLAILDLSESGHQPMVAPSGNIICHNGEVYNYVELRSQLEGSYPFKSTSDTETILAAYQQFGENCVDHLRGMFAFAIYDSGKNSLFLARDRFGIKPLYYVETKDCFVFASEMKALLPFLDDIKTNRNSLAEYLVFQYTLGEDTLFDGVRQLMPGHCLTVNNGTVRVRKYWDVNFTIDWEHSERYFIEKLDSLVSDSVRVHMRSDVPVGAYMSGGIDSSLITKMASSTSNMAAGFHGKFTDFPGYDESPYARMAAENAGVNLLEKVITWQDFQDNIEKVIYHLDTPIAGPGSFPQYMVSEMASQHVKVCIGGQGGDEIFGGYARYLVAYLEQCLKAAIEGTYQSGNFVVTLESIIPNLPLLREYTPLMQMLWSKDLFGPLDARYYRLINRAEDMLQEVKMEQLDLEAVFVSFQKIFNAENVGKQAYFDKMTHFDFKCLLPALLQVEDRVSMAHGLESRVPFLDHDVVSFAASVPADTKFEDGKQKRLLTKALGRHLPEGLLSRRDKMGFPVPLSEWFGGPLHDFVNDVFEGQDSRERDLFNRDAIRESISGTARFSRKMWGLLSLELWHQQFHDRASDWRALLT